MTFNDPTSLTVNVLTPEQDYFYWPCMSGEKYAPTLSNGAGTGSATYSSFTQYPAVRVSHPSISFPASSTWPNLPSWKYSRTSFQGYTLSFRVNLGGSNTNAGVLFNTNGLDEISITVGANIVGTFNSVTVNTTFPAAQTTWYSLILTYDATGVMNGSINGASLFSNVATRATIDILAPKAQSVCNGGGSAEAYVSQLQVTYS